MALKHILKGLISFAVPTMVRPRRTGGSDSARYCYSVFMRHLKAVHAITGRVPRGAVAELGPGDSLGVGLAALLAGATKYQAYDIVAFTARERNLAVFDELTELFCARAAVPGNQEFPNLKPGLDDVSFPHELLPDARLSVALDPERLAALRQEIAEGALDGTGAICYRAPWGNDAYSDVCSASWIFSQAVMAQIDDLAGAYRACGIWLCEGGIMSHQIDFGCLGTANSWDGHRAYSTSMWKIVRGRRTFLINRLPPSYHRKLLTQNGFRISGEIVVREEPRIAHGNLALPFRNWQDDDLTAKSVFQVSEKLPQSGGKGRTP